MNPIEELTHLQKALKHPLFDAAARMALVQQLKAQALRRLSGQTIEFDAEDRDQCVSVAQSVAGSNASGKVKAAAQLLRLCIHMAEAPETFDGPMLVSVYAQLDMHAVKRDGAMQVGRSMGGKNKPAKLPPTDELRQELVKLMAKRRDLSKPEAVGILCRRYECTRQALNRKLSKKS